MARRVACRPAPSGSLLARRLKLVCALLGLVLAAGLLAVPAGSARVAHGATARSTRTFHSEPWLHPQPVHVSADPDVSSGDIFLTPGHHRVGGLMILNPKGQLVWFRSLAPEKAVNLEVQSYRGKPALTWWQGHVGGRGGYVIANRSYRTLAVVRAGHGEKTDPHDFVIAPHGTAWLVGTRLVKANLTRVGGPRHGLVWDKVIQKVDIATGKVLWQWDAYRHIPLNASYAPPRGHYYDAYHLNSIQQVSPGKLLVSSRSTWSVYEISIRTGRVIWTLGGKYSSFRVSSGARFEWQHAARLHGNTLTLFDDAASPQEEPQSSAKVIRLNPRRRTARLIHAYFHSPPLLTGSQGNAQTLRDGNIFVGWGDQPDFSEYARSGRQIFTGTFALGTASYRALRFHWTGWPSGRPAIAAHDGPHGTANVWASWNGATSIASWRVLGGASAARLHPVDRRARASFETQIRLAHHPRYVAVQALGRRGQVLGTSATRWLGGGGHSASAPARMPASRGRADAAGRPAHAAAGPSQHFHSERGLRPPVVRVTSDPDSRSGDIFLTPEHSPQTGPMILNPKGQLVWFYPVNAPGVLDAFNLQVQRYQGRPVLTWWRGNVGGQPSEDVIMNSSYRTIATVHAANGYTTDEHEFLLTPRGTAFITVYRPEQANLSSVGGSSNATVSDNAIQEIDVRTGRLVWQWDSVAHVPFSDSYSRPHGEGWYDWFHANSIQQLPDGNVLVSARNTWTVYEIDYHTGRVILRIGGKHSSFRFAHGARFSWQHDARLSHGRLSLFDDAFAGRGQQEESQSSAKLLKVNQRTRTVSLVKRYTHRPPLLTALEGSMQHLPNHDVFVGWGGAPEFAQYSPGGRQIFNGSFALGVDSYRAFRFPWHGHPLTRPRMALLPRPGGNVKLWASWNGATNVAAWRVRGGPDRLTLRGLGVTRRSNFETAVSLSSQPRYLAVQALNAHGRVLGSARAQRLPRHLNVFGARSLVSSSSGDGKIPVGCFTGHTCHARLRIASGKSVLAHTRPEKVFSGRGALLSFHLSSAGLARLNSSPSHHLPVEVTVTDRSGVAVRWHAALVPFSTTGRGPSRKLSETSRLRILGATEFVSASGAGGILAACYALTPCRVRTTVTAQGRPIATGQPQRVGVNELAYLSFQLTPQGRSMLAAATGNQLAAHVTLTSQGHTATGHVALVGYR
jgi:hypothetical protein